MGDSKSQNILFHSPDWASAQKVWLHHWMTFFSYNVLNVNSSKCVSVNNQEGRAIPEVTNINSNEPLFYPYSVKINAVVVVMISMTYMQNYVVL